MCAFCGCSTPRESSAATSGAATTSHGHGHPPAGHGHEHDHHHHHHEHGDDSTRLVEMSRNILDKNARLAERARGIFLAKGIAVLNLVSSPGSGKTTLLQQTILRLRERTKCAVIVGDCATDNDARRLRETGAPAVQIVTGTVCHLDAHMVLHALEELRLGDTELLFIENVGNLVCPTAFDLGEDHRVVLTAVTEGEDKPLKYPGIFHDAHVVLLTKTDLAAAAGVDLVAARRNIQTVAPGAKLLELSARSGDGMAAWISWLEGIVQAKRAVAF